MKRLIIILLISVLLLGCAESRGYSDTKDTVGGTQEGNSQGVIQGGSLEEHKEITVIRLLQHLSKIHRLRHLIKKINTGLSV